MNEDVERLAPATVEVRNAGNVIVGDHGIQVSHHWHDPKIRRWIIAVVVVLAVAAVVFAWIFWPRSPRPLVELAGIAVADSRELDADETWPGPTPPRSTTVATTPVDITVKNNGTAPAVIVRAEVRFDFIEMLPNCLGAGPGLVTANYDVKFPLFAKLPPRPFTLERPMRFYIEPGTADRFTLTLGPEEQSIVSTLLVGAHVSLVLDDSSTVDLGNVALLAQPGTGKERLGVRNELVTGSV